MFRSIFGYLFLTAASGLTAAGICYHPPDGVRDFENAEMHEVRGTGLDLTCPVKVIRNCSGTYTLCESGSCFRRTNYLGGSPIICDSFDDNGKGAKDVSDTFASYEEIGGESSEHSEIEVVELGFPCRKICDRVRLCKRGDDKKYHCEVANCPADVNGDEGGEILYMAQSQLQSMSGPCQSADDDTGSNPM